MILLFSPTASAARSARVSAVPDDSVASSAAALLVAALSVTALMVALSPFRFGV